MSSHWNQYLVNGIKVPSGQTTPVRKEIRDLSKEELYLYIEGLARFQQTDSNDPLSYYQIAGIHGLPYTTWPNQSWNKDIPLVDNWFRGFCTHASVLFLPWHRPFLALFEAALYNHVNAIASGIDDASPEKAKYVAAATNFRIPYWDWARPDQSSIFPRESLDNVRLASGPPSTAAVDHQYNPLYLSPLPTGADRGLTRINNQDFKTTVRYPELGDSNSARRAIWNSVKDFYDNPNMQGTASGKNLTERVAYILLSYQRYGPMSNNLYQPKNSDDLTANAEIWGSLEDIHNSVHGTVGGRTGHMGDPAKAAFDPVFWLHHANIDRLFSIWQALHENDEDPEAWVTTQQAGWGNITIQELQDETADTKLYPFRDTNASWYTSRTVKRTESFGYAYPETVGLKYPTSDAAKQGLKTKVENYYTPPARMIFQSRNRVKTAGAQLLPQAALLKTIANEKVLAKHEEVAKVEANIAEPQILLQHSLDPSKPLLRDLAPDNKYLEWLVNIKAERHSQDGAYTVFVFLGPVEEDQVDLWPLSPHYVGTFNPFGQATDTACRKCQDEQQDRIQVTGQIPLTVALMERYLAELIPNLSTEAVVPYLTENLHWRVELNGAALDNRAEVNGLTVFVVSNEATVPENESQLPIYAPNVTIHPEITTNRNGEGRGNGTGLAAGQE